MAQGEDEFVAWLASRKRETRRGLRIGIGDDMAMVDPRGAGGSTGKSMLVTADMLMDGVDFETTLHPPELIGRKAMAASLSDCAAMAVRPRFALASVALPRTWSLRQVQRLCVGLEAMGRAYDCVLIGGDTNSWRHPLVIDVIVLAEPWTDAAPVRRSGVRVGDIICVTGRLGGTMWVGKHRMAETPRRRDARAARRTKSARRPLRECRRVAKLQIPHHLGFEPRVQEARYLAARLGAGLHAMMDLSDGLSTDAARMALASNCGIEFDVEAVEGVASSAAKAASAEDRRGVLDHVLNDGEDFELLFAVSPRVLRRLEDTAGRIRPGSRAGFCEAGVPGEQTPWTAIGVAVGGRGVWLRRRDGKREALPSGGWRHSIGP
jgi:thiamine-monophosphate kinase